MATASQQVARCTSCTFTMFSVVRSKLSEGIDPFLLSCWACLSHDVLTVCKRQTHLTVSDLLMAGFTELLFGNEGVDQFAVGEDK